MKEFFYNLFHKEDLKNFWKYLERYELHEYASEKYGK
jgi:hypothetical protein